MYSIEQNSQFKNFEFQMTYTKLLCKSAQQTLEEILNDRNIQPKNSNSCIEAAKCGYPHNRLPAAK